MSPLLIWFRRICWLGVAVWVSTVYMLSSFSGPQIAEMNAFDVNDKLLHFAAFFCGALPLVPALRLTWGWNWVRVLWTTVAALSIYGGLDEVHQYWTPSRSALDPFDWIADTLGALAGAPLAAYIHALIDRRNRKTPARN